MTTRLSTLSLFLLLSLSSLAADSNVIGGLRRAPFLGAALKPSAAGVTIDGAGPGTAAEKMGLQAGDLVVSVDGQPVTDPASFSAAIRKKRAGDAVTVVVRRGSETLTKQGTLAPLPLEQRADYDIDYDSVDAGGVKRRVIVTHPHGAGKHPAVLLIGGIGCYSLDGILRPAELRDSYAKLLDTLTRAGYVTMRVEKSGAGDSEGPSCMDPRYDFDAEVRGYVAGLARLQALDSVDARNVFVFAHSIGPLVAARLVSEHPVRGLVVAETIGTSWIEYDLTNLRRQLILSGMPYDQVDARVRHHELCAHRYYIEKQTPEQILAADKSCAEDLELPAPYTYMQQLGSLDLAPLWKKIDAPVLVLYGTADYVTDDYQSRYLRDMINAFHPGRAKYIAIEGMDHGLTIKDAVAQQFIDETVKLFESLRV